MLISEALNLKERAFISLVGAGGKSTLFNRLAEELALKNKRMILTTTTKMFSWQLTPFIKKGNLIEFNDEKIIEDNIKEYFHHNKIGEIVLIHHRIIEEEEGEKVSGPAPLYLDKWWKEKLAEELVTQILRYNKKRIDDIIIGATNQVTNPVIEVIKRVK